MEAKRSRIYVISTAAVGAAGSIILAFGPDLLESWRTRHEVAERRSLSTKQNELLEKNSEVMRNLERTLRELTGSPIQADEPRLQASEPAPVDTRLADDHAASPVEASEPPAVELTSTRRPAAPPERMKQSSDGMGVAAKPGPTGSDPSLTSGETERFPRVSSRDATRTFGVFEGQEFELCGYGQFTASLTTEMRGNPAVAIASTNRAIPDRNFRGYQKTLPLQSPVVLWQDCVVAVGQSVSAGVERIVFSVSGEGGS